MEHFRISFSFGQVGGRYRAVPIFFLLFFVSRIFLSTYCIVFLRFFHVVMLNTVHNY